MLAIVGPRVQACPCGVAHAVHANYLQTLHQVSLRDSSIRNREEEDNGREADQERRRGDSDTRREDGRHGLQSDDSDDSRPGACEDSRHRAGDKIIMRIVGMRVDIRVRVHAHAQEWEMGTGRDMDKEVAVQAVQQK